MKRNYRTQFILSILLVIFLAPTLVGILLYHYPHWLTQRTTNQGQLLTPPIRLKTLEPAATWRLIYWSPKPCAATCLAQLKQLSRIRLALGRQFYQVHITLLQADNSTVIATTALQPQALEILTLDPADRPALAAFQTPTLFIADPQHALILRYTTTDASDALFHDLKHLLSINQTSEPVHAFPSN